MSDSRTDAASLHCIFPRLKLHDPRSTCQRCGDNMGPIRDTALPYVIVNSHVPQRHCHVSPCQSNAQKSWQKCKKVRTRATAPPARAGRGAAHDPRTTTSSGSPREIRARATISISAVALVAVRFYYGSAHQHSSADGCCLSRSCCFASSSRRQRSPARRGNSAIIATLVR